MRKQSIIDFNLDPDLGQTIENKWPMAFGAAPIKEFKEIVFAAGGNKFSNLCGFKFLSKAPTPYKEFFICFVAKLRSKIYKQQLTNPSQWFIFKRISGTEIHCLSKNDLLVQYGFDINKFYQSDYFIKMLPKLISTVKRGVNVYIPEYVKQHGSELAIANLTSYDGDQSDTIEKCVGRYVNSIQEAIPFISDTRTNNKFYKLVNLDIHVENELNEASFDQYDWKNGSLTGKGLIDMIQDSGVGKQNTLNAPVRVYDRSTNKYYNIIDSHLGKSNTGLMIEIDTRKEISESNDSAAIDAKWKELRRRWKHPRQDGDIMEEILSIVPDFRKRIYNEFRGAITDDRLDNAITYVLDNEGNEKLWDKSETFDQFLNNVIDVAADKRAEVKESNGEANRDEKELNDKLDEAMKEIYK